MSDSQELYNRLNEKLSVNSCKKWKTGDQRDLDRGRHSAKPIFKFEQDRLQHVERIDHLLLAIAIATLWCHELGEFVLKQGDTFRS